METPVSLKASERKAFHTAFADGLWDVFIGCFALEFAIAPLLSESLGDFWSSAIFLPFWGLVYLAIWLTRKYVVTPRMGSARFGKARVNKLRKFSLIMVVINIVLLGLGLWAAFFLRDYTKGYFISLLLGIFCLAGFGLAATLLDCPRLYLYGLLLLAAPPVGEWLYQNHGASHHGYPIVFGFTSAVMILTGLTLFVRLIKNNPPIEIPEQGS